MNQREVLKKFLEAQAKAEDIKLDSFMIRAINNCIELEPRPSNEAEEVRTVTITEASDGSVTAESFKLYNISEVSIYDILTLVVKEYTGLLLADNLKEAMIVIFVLLWEFYPKLKIEFKGQDAQVLLAISLIETKAFSLNDLQEKIQQQQTEDIELTSLNRSLNYLIKLKVIKRTAKDEYKKVEKLKNVSRF